jgi:hypothetical protein
MAKTKTKTKAKTKSPSKPANPAKHVPLSTLLSLLGKTEDDPAVLAVLDTAGEIEISKHDFIVAKDAGFDISLERVKGQKKRTLSTLFLFPEGRDGHHGFNDLPAGFGFVTRRELLANHPNPIRSSNFDSDKLPLETPDSDVVNESWRVGDHDVSVQYGHKTGGAVRHFYIALPEGDTYDGPLDTDPLYYGVLPYDSPPGAELVGMALIAAWATDRFGLSAKHANSELGMQLAQRAITPCTFLVKACGKTLAATDVVPKVGKFLATYTYNLHQRTPEERKPINSQIMALLKIERDDERRYTDDFLGTFADVCESPHYVPDSWDAVDRIAPVLDARLADYEATQFETIPDLALYETAARLRDQQAVTPAPAMIPPATIDDSLADELVALIDKPLTDKHVKAVLTRAGMPIGKRIDAQANPALGASYMGAKFEIDGKHQLGVEDVAFYADKHEHPIRGIGKTVRFRGYPGPLPYGLRLGDSRDTVRAKVGMAAAGLKSSDDSDWFETKTRATSFRYEDGKLVMLRIGRPRDY